MQPDTKRILCVENDPDICELLTAMLSSEYEVKSAKTLTEGWLWVTSEPFDLIILDSLLPDGSGVNLCRRLRAVNPSLPIIIFSGLAYEADRRIGLAAGAQAYLIKPDDLERLGEMVERLLSEAEVKASSASR